MNMKSIRRVIFSQVDRQQPQLQQQKQQRRRQIIIGHGLNRTTNNPYILLSLYTLSLLLLLINLNVIVALEDSLFQSPFVVKGRTVNNIITSKRDLNSFDNYDQQLRDLPRAKSFQRTEDRNERHLNGVLGEENPFLLKSRQKRESVKDGSEELEQQKDIHYEKEELQQQKDISYEKVVSQRRNGLGDDGEAGVVKKEAKKVEPLSKKGLKVDSAGLKYELEFSDRSDDVKKLTGGEHQRPQLLLNASANPYGGSLRELIRRKKQALRELLEENAAERKQAIPIIYNRNSELFLKYLNSRTKPEIVDIGNDPEFLEGEFAELFWDEKALSGDFLTISDNETEEKEKKEQKIYRNKIGNDHVDLEEFRRKNAEAILRHRLENELKPIKSTTTATTKRTTTTLRPEKPSLTPTSALKIRKSENSIFESAKTTQKSFNKNGDRKHFVQVTKTPPPPPLFVSPETQTEKVIKIEKHSPPTLSHHPSHKPTQSNKHQQHQPPQTNHGVVIHENSHQTNFVINTRQTETGFKTETKHTKTGFKTETKHTKTGFKTETKHPTGGSSFKFVSQQRPPVEQRPKQTVIQILVSNPEVQTGLLDVEDYQTVFKNSDIPWTKKSQPVKKEIGDILYRGDFDAQKTSGGKTKPSPFTPTVRPTSTRPPFTPTVRPTRPPTPTSTPFPTTLFREAMGVTVEPYRQPKRVRFGDDESAANQIIYLPRKNVTLAIATTTKPSPAPSPGVVYYKPVKQVPPRPFKPMFSQEQLTQRPHTTTVKTHPPQRLPQAQPLTSGYPAPSTKYVSVQQPPPPPPPPPPVPIQSPPVQYQQPQSQSPTVQYQQTHSQIPPVQYQQPQNPPPPPPPRPYFGASLPPQKPLYQQPPPKQQQSILYQNQKPHSPPKIYESQQHVNLHRPPPPQVPSYPPPPVRGGPPSKYSNRDTTPHPLVYGFQPLVLHGHFEQPRSRKTNRSSRRYPTLKLPPFFQK